MTLEERLRDALLAADELDRLRAENEALRKDAERYRWLRNNWPANICALAWTEEAGRSDDVANDPDAAIDAAMKEKQWTRNTKTRNMENWTAQSGHSSGHA